MMHETEEIPIKNPKALHFYFALLGEEGLGRLMMLKVYMGTN